MGRQEAVLNTSAYGAFLPTKHARYVSNGIYRVRGIEYDLATGIRIHIQFLHRAVPYQGTTGE